MSTRQGSSAPSMGSTYAGSLQAKKKAELQEIAQALSVSHAGTREDLQQRIRKHLDDNSKEYEDDPTFSGLFGARKRQRSLQPQQLVQEKASSSRQSLASLDIIQEARESSPIGSDVQDVSMMIPQVQSPITTRTFVPNTPPITRATFDNLTPSSLPPLPPSPTKSIIAEAMAQPEVKAVVEMNRNMVGGATQIYYQTRSMLSSATNIFVLTAVFEVVSILLTIHNDAPFPLPPLSVNMAPTMNVLVLTITHWAFPSVFIPVLVGYLISFHYPAGSGRFDPLSASIIRIACNVAYSFPLIRLDGYHGMLSLDVLGPKWRVLVGSIALAFSFAEAVSRPRPTNADVVVELPTDPFILPDI